MRRIWKVLIGLGSALAVLGVSATAVAMNNSDKLISGTTDHSIYQVGQTVTITGTVNGDIYCAAQTVTIDATVNGDVLCAGQTVTVHGTVSGSLRIAAQTVNVGAKADRNVSLVAQDITLENNAFVGNDLSLVGQTANVDSMVGRDVHGAVQTMVLASQIGRDVDVNVDKLALNDGAHIGRNLSYTSTHRSTGLGASSMPKVGGQVTYHYLAKSSQGGWGRQYVAWQLYMLIALLVLSLVLSALMPQLLGRWHKLAASKVWVSILTGFVAMIITPAILIALAFTLVGIPLVILIALGWLVLALLSAPMAAFYVGHLVMPGERRIPLIVLVGGAILGIVCLVPVLGMIVTFLALWYGLGGLLLNLRASYKKPAYRL